MPLPTQGRLWSTASSVALASSIVLAGCSGAPSAPAPSAGASTAASAAASAAASPSQAASPSAAASPSPAPSASVASCLDKATFALLGLVEDPQTIEANAPAIIAGLEAWAPAADADAQYRDQVVAALKASDWENAGLLMFRGVATGDWKVIACT